MQAHYLIDGQETDNIHKWSLQLAPNAEKVVSEVTYKLHPTFRDPIVKCTKFPFQLSRIGWGTFEIGVSILLNTGQTLETSHKLTFKEAGDTVKTTEVALP